MANDSMEFHPAANLFPFDDENLDALAEDIRANGLMCPIELYKGKILDGRRRWVACRMAGNDDPDMIVVSPVDPIAYVISLNVHRRHLTPSQRAMVAAKAREMHRRGAENRRKAGKKLTPPREGVVDVPDPLSEGDTRDCAGKALGVSGKTVDFATKVLEQGTPELVKAVEEGRMAVSTAAVHASEPADVQKAIVADPKRRRTYKSVSKPPAEAPEPEPQPEPGKSRGVGIQRAHEAIACLKQIPQNDPLRKRGFQVVSDWIKHNQ